MKRKKFTRDLFLKLGKDDDGMRPAFSGTYHDGDNNCAVSSEGHLLLIEKDAAKKEYFGKVISPEGKELEVLRYPNYRAVLNVVRSNLQELTAPDFSEEIEQFWALKTDEYRGGKKLVNKRGLYTVCLDELVYGPGRGIDLYFYYNIMLPLGVENFKFSNDMWYYEDDKKIVVMCGAVSDCRTRHEMYTENIGIHC